MTYKKRDNDFNVNEFQITERNVSALNGFTDLNLQGDSSYSNEAFSMEGENGKFGPWISGRFSIFSAHRHPAVRQLEC